MIVFVQSYTAPKTMDADNGVFKRVCDRFPDEVMPIDYYVKT